MYSASDIEKLNARDIEYPDGSMHTQYEAEQYQRACERKIRETKRKLAGFDEVIKTTDDNVVKENAQWNFDKNSLKLKNQEQSMRSFCQQTGLMVDSSRSLVYGFGKSSAQKAVQRDKLINNVCDMYKTDFGSMSKMQVFDLDRRAIKEKRENFSSKYKSSGNFAIMNYNNEYYYAHSQANIENGIESPAFEKYKGDKTHLARTEVDSSKRNFETFDVEQSTGKKHLSTSTDKNRYSTFEDTEAKLFESLENMWYNYKNKTINILSERGMCDSCKYVAEQFIKKHPEVKVNIVSGKQATGNPWKGRKKYD